MDAYAPFDFDRVTLIRSPSWSTWSRVTGWRLQFLGPG
jgi:hypothetical protein